MTSAKMGFMGIQLVVVMVSFCHLHVSKGKYLSLNVLSIKNLKIESKLMHFIATVQFCIFFHSQTYKEIQIF